jgi:S1-C subfamily serine protease
MGTQDMCKRRLVSFAVAIAVALISVNELAAQAKDAPRLAEIPSKVGNSIVVVKTRRSLGNGFAADATGLVVTNYHVIEGAKEIRVLFPSDKGAKPYVVEGFVAVLPQSDLALIKIKLDGKTLAPLKFAKNPPAQGDWVAAFGLLPGSAPMVAEGKILGIRAGDQLVETTRLGSKSVYEMMGYSPKLRWLQHTAPMAFGASGGPLVDSRGEVVGINTWVWPPGQNSVFALSARHITQFLSTAGTTVHPLSDLPPARSREPNQ